MLTILFDIFPATGHYNATLKLAKLLHERGHRLVYIGPDEFSGKIKSLGLEFHRVAPHILEPDVAEHGVLIFFVESVLKSFAKVKWDAAVGRLKEYDRIIEKYLPDLIILDDHCIYKAVFYHRYKVKVVAVQSMIAKERGALVPPFQSTFLPTGNVIDDAFINSLWRIHFIKKKFKVHLNRIVSFGQDNFSLLKKFAAAYNFPFEKNINYHLSFGTEFRHIPLLRLSPRDFDFPRKESSNHFYIGPLADLHREKLIADARYLMVVENLARLKSTGQRLFIIYCSLGTVTDDNIKLCDVFFKRIGQVARSNSHYSIILSVGMRYNINRLLPKPPNLFIFQTVPQIDLLSRCDLMINHGGINSISECVFAGIPMISFPLSPDWDQNGCGARVVFHGLGLRGRIKSDSATVISRKIEFIVQRYHEYRTSVLAMRTKFSVFNSSNEAVSIIERIVRNN